MDTVLLTAARHVPLLEFLGRRDQGFCFCRYWFFDGENEAWLRCDPARNRAAMEAALAAGELWGIVAVADPVTDAGTEVVGWLRLAPSAEVDKLGDPTPEAASVLCMSVAEEHRGQGVARALLRSAIDEVRARGFRELRAYPRFADDLDAGAVWTGPRGLYASEGFVKVGGGERRHTYALTLRT